MGWFTKSSIHVGRTGQVELFVLTALIYFSYRKISRFMQYSDIILIEISNMKLSIRKKIEHFKHVIGKKLGIFLLAPSCLILVPQSV